MPRSNMYAVRTALVLSTIANSCIDQVRCALQGRHNGLQILKEIASLPKCPRRPDGTPMAERVKADSNFLLRIKVYTRVLRTYLKL